MKISFCIYKRFRASLQCFKITSESFFSLLFKINEENMFLHEIMTTEQTVFFSFSFLYNQAVIKSMLLNIKIFQYFDFFWFNFELMFNVNVDLMILEYLLNSLFMKN